MNSFARETTREDGLRIITKSLPHAKRTRLAILCGAGSAYDPNGKEGLHHYLEHAVHMGTANMSSFEHRCLVEQYFLLYNAETKRVETSYFGEAVYTRFETLCKVLFDVYLNAVFPQEDIEREKEVMLNEIALDNDSDGSKAHKALSWCLWKNHPLGSHGIGTVEGINAVTREILLDTVKRYHIPSNTVIIGTGRIDHDLLTARAFESFPFNAKKVARIYCPDDGTGPPAKRRELVKMPGRERAVLVFGCKIPLFSFRESAVFSTLAYILDSMIEEEIREKRGFAYVTGGSWRIDHALGADVRFAIGTLPKRVEIIEALTPEILCSYPLSKDQFLRTKDKLMDGSLVSLERPADWERIIASRIVEEGEGISMLRSYSRLHKKAIANVEFAEVAAMRERIFSQDRLACVIVKPS